jgi:hypothetical protein
LQFVPLWSFADAWCNPGVLHFLLLRLGGSDLIPTRLTQSKLLAMMPLYYLHIRNSDKLEIDPDGTELPDLDAAVVEALKVARELVGEVDDLGRDAVIEIADGSGETILTVPFSDAVRAH